MFGYVGLFSAAVDRQQSDPNGFPNIYADRNKKIDGLFAKKPNLFWIGIGKTDFLYKTITTYVLTSTQRDISTPTLKPMVVTSGATGASISQNLHHFYLNNTYVKIRIFRLNLLKKII